MKISIIIPCFNEEKTLSKIVDKVLLFKSYEKEIIIVDDCSEDNTPNIINDLVAKFNEIKSIRHEKNYGKGAGIKSGVKISTGDIILIQDADLEYDPSDYKKLLFPFEKYDADVVYGSRFKSSEVNRMIDACKKNNVILGDGHERRFESGWPKLHHLVTKNTLGTIMYAEGHFSHDKLSNLSLDNWRTKSQFAPAAGMTGMGVHFYRRRK